MMKIIPCLIGEFKQQKMGFNEEYMGVSLINDGFWVLKKGPILPNLMEPIPIVIVYLHLFVS